MGGLDALVFTAGIGENSPVVRKKCCENLEFLGIQIDEEKNEEAIRVEAEIQTDDSPVKIFCIPTNEELVIALDTKRIIEEAKERKEMHKGL